MSRKYTNKSGFTLIELVITIAILAILLSIGVPAFANYLPDTTKSMCQKNMDAILVKYEYAVANYNQRMHTDVYEKVSEVRDEILKEIQIEVLTEIDSTLSCPKEGNYEIFDRITVAGHVTKVNCSIHDQDSRTAEEIMLDKIRIDMYKEIETCRIGSKDEFDRTCLQNLYGSQYFHSSSSTVSGSNLFRDEHIGAIVFGTYENGWPMLDPAMFDTIHVFDKTKVDDLYIRPKYLTPGNGDLILFASNENKIGNWNNACALYYEGQWYKLSVVNKHPYTGEVTPGKISITSYVKKDMIEKDISVGKLIPIEEDYEVDLTPQT